MIFFYLTVIILLLKGVLMRYFKVKSLTKIGHKDALFVIDDNKHIIDYQIIHKGLELLAVNTLKEKYPSITKDINYLRIIDREKHWDYFASIINHRLKNRRRPYV